MSNHTPTPWRKGKPSDAIVAEDPPGQGSVHHEYYGGLLIAESMEQSDRDFILRAVNSHEALLWSCKVMCDLLEKRSLSPPHKQFVSQVLERAQAAIAKATGQEG